MPTTMASPTKCTRPSKGTVKTSLSCPKAVYEFANDQVSKRGFRSFSGYVEFLIRLQQQPTGTQQ